MTLSHWSFSYQSLLGFFYNRSSSSALYSDDFFWKWLMKNFEDINILIVKLFCLKNLFSFGKSFYLKNNTSLEMKVCLKKKFKNC